MQSHEHEMGRDQFADELRAWNAASEALESECRHCGGAITYEAGTGRRGDEWLHDDSLESACSDDEGNGLATEAEPPAGYDMPRTTEDMQTDLLSLDYRRTVRLWFGFGGPNVCADLEIDDEGEAIRGTYFDSWAVPNERELYSEEVSALEAVYGPFEAVADGSMYR